MPNSSKAGFKSHYSNGKMRSFDRAFLPSSLVNLHWEDGPKKIKVEVVR